MDSMRLTVIKKTVCFTEHNKVFLIPPRESPPRNDLIIPFLDPFYWKMPPSTEPLALTQLHSPLMSYFNSHPPWQTSGMFTYYLLVRHAQDNYATFIFLWQMIVRQEEEAEQWRQQELNKLNLLHKFTEVSFEEACFNRLNNILQPVIHFRQERNHRHHQRTGFSPPVVPSNSSSLPSPLQWPQQPSIPSPIISNSSDNSDLSIPQAPVSSFYNPIVVEDDDCYDFDRFSLLQTWSVTVVKLVVKFVRLSDYKIALV